MARLCLNLTFDEAFLSYKESWSKNCLFFEGVLREDFAGASDLRVIDFVSGGRRYKAYKLDRRGASCKGWVRHYPFVPAAKQDDKQVGHRSLDDEGVARVDELREQGVSQVDIADMLGVSSWTISQVVNRRGAYAGVDN